MGDRNKICVAGIGAVGGVLAALLCRKYPEDVTLIARGKRAASLKEKGVVLHSEFYGEIAAKPGRVAETGAELDIQDYVFICVKNYSLDQIAESVRPCVGPETVVVPVVNGVEAGDRLRVLFPEANVIDAVIYTTTGANEDFSITQKGTYTHLFIGNKIRDERHRDGAVRAHQLLKEAGCDARLSENIEKDIWEKYILNCAYNTLTALHQVTTSDIRKSPKLKEDILALLQEVQTVSEAEGIGLAGDIAEQKYHFILEEQADGATSSMKRDVEAKRPVEADAFSGAILRKAAAAGIPVPVMEWYHRELCAVVEAYS